MKVEVDGMTFVFRRGFIAEVSLTAEAFAGGPCRACMEPNEDVPHPQCRVCHGKGCPGHAAALFKSAPVVAVKLDREPYQGTAWARQDRDDGPNVRWALPPDLFDCLPDRVARGSTIQARCVNWVEYQDTPTAHDALAAAALLYGRRRGWPCPRCQGNGRVRVMSVASDPANPCPDCHGLGHTVEAPA